MDFEKPPGYPYADCVNVQGLGYQTIYEPESKLNSLQGLWKVFYWRVFLGYWDSRSLNMAHIGQTSICLYRVPCICENYLDFLNPMP